MKPQNQPHPSIKKTYGAKVQYANPPNEMPALDKAGKRFIQEVTGVFLFLARAVDGTMLTPLSALTSEQASPMELTMEKCLQFLYYTTTQDDAILTYNSICSLDFFFWRAPFSYFFCSDGKGEHPKTDRRRTKIQQREALFSPR